MAVIELIRNKKYKIEVTIGYSGNQKIRHYETFHGGKKDAVLRENEIKMQLQNNTYSRNNKLTMNELIDEWLKSKNGSIGIKTFKEYSNYCNNIKQSIGNIKVKDINVKILEDFYNSLKNVSHSKRTTGYFEKSIKHHYVLISNIFNSAIKWGYMYTNPNQSVTPIKVHKKEIQCYSPEEVKALVQALENEPVKYQAIIMLALDSGCRRGELTGLTWSDVDFDNNTININKTTQYVAGHGVFEKSTKSDTSNRIIYLSPTTMKILKKYKIEQDKRKLFLGSKWKNSNRIFTTDDGGDMHPDTPSKILDKVIKVHNLKRISFHGLRHTCISLQIFGGVQAQIISKRAGHSSVSVTHNVYSHFFNNEFKDVANKMNTFLYDEKIQEAVK